MRGFHTFQVCNLLCEASFSPWENMRMVRYVLNHSTPQGCAIFSLAEVSPVLICSRVCNFGHGHFFEPFFLMFQDSFYVHSHKSFEGPEQKCV